MSEGKHLTPMSNKEKRTTNQNFASKFILGGLAGVSSTCIVQPFDLLKSRLQVQGEGTKIKKSFIQVALEIKKKEGILTFYNGLSAALTRQIFYTTTRMGSFDSFYQIYKEKYHAEPILIEKMLMGSCAGAIGAVVGTPAEVALIKMTVSKKLETGLLKTWLNIIRTNGPLGLWSGCMPTIYRCMAVNCTQLASYAQLKQYISSKGLEGYPNYLCASFGSGLLTSIASLPLDMAKTRVQKASSDQYKNTFDVMSQVVRNEGVLSLWKGFFPYFIRIGSHTMLCFLFLEKYKEIYSKNFS